MTSKNNMAVVAGLTALLVQPQVFADVTATDILNILVDEGILSQEKALALVEKVREREQRAASEPPLETAAQAANSVRVPYIPSHVKNEIKTTVREEVIDELQGNVVRRAREEGWGIEGAPAWVNRITLSGDVRMRYEGRFFPSDNPDNVFFDINDINDAGGVDAAGRDSLVNTVDDRHRLRTRARLRLTMAPAEGVEVGVRLLTGNEGNPVSANQTMGNFGRKWASSFDLAYINYRTPAGGLELSGGRFSNPWLHTNLIWDNDMTFEGVNASYFPLRSVDDMSPRWDPYIKLGAFPLQEINQAVLPGDVFEPPNDDKWLYAAQLGNSFSFSEDSRLQLALTYYYFDGVLGEDNAVNQDGRDATASPFYQFGNTLQNIALADDGGSQRELFALASEFELANLTMRYDYTGFEKHRMSVIADGVVNLAFDGDDIQSRIGEGFVVPDRDTGYQLGFEFGTKSMSRWGDWRTTLQYRYLEGDAVLDAFTDSNFLLGGTNAKGYVLRGEMYLTDRVSLALRWISGEEIDAADVFDDDGRVLESDVEVDTVHVDVQAKF